MIDSEKLLECLNNIDDELIERSDIISKSLVKRCVVSGIKLLAACVAVVLISIFIYETNKEYIVKDYETTSEKEASVIDLEVFDVGLTEDGKITNEYYAIAAAIGNIHYEGINYRIVAGVDVGYEAIGENIDTYFEINRRTDIFEEEYIQVALYKMTDMDKYAGVAFSINGHGPYYFAVNTDYMEISQEIFGK